MKLNLHSEFGTLRAVLMHRPGREIERLTPYNIKELLFEDVPYLDGMQYEHDVFTQTIRDACGAKVFRLTDLLMQSFKEENILLEALKSDLSENNLEFLAESIIEHYSKAECAVILMAGIKVKELQKRFFSKVLEKFDESFFIIRPSPNLYFMRDPAAVIQSGVISSQLKYKARKRESILVKSIFKNHPLFKDNFNLIYPSKNLEPHNIPSIEGGDIIILSEKALAIGYSERTEPSAIKEVARELFKYPKVERVYQVHLEAKRNFMHLDTVFSIIDENLVVTYPDALNALLETRVYHKDGVDAEGNTIIGTEIIEESILTVLKREIPHLDIIKTGDGNPDYAAREQWFDGANVFAIGPRRVISYNRNKHTNRALREAGVEVLEIPASELARGLGGPRCMTMPLDRDEV